jgi:hypothetical protein
MKPNEVRHPHPDRRDMLKESAAAGLAAVLHPVDPLNGAARAQRSLIRAENEKPGTRDWLLRNTRVDPKTKYRCPWVEGYCSATSVRAGESLDIMVSTNPASPFVIDLYRLGYYRGKGGRHLLRLGPFKGKAQPDPKVGKQRLRECQGEPATKLVIPGDWPSGVYLGLRTIDASGLLRLALHGNRRQFRLAQLRVQRLQLLAAQLAPAPQQPGKRLLRLAAGQYDLEGRRRIRTLKDSQ